MLIKGLHDTEPLDKHGLGKVVSYWQKYNIEIPMDYLTMTKITTVWSVNLKIYYMASFYLHTKWKNTHMPTADWQLYDHSGDVCSSRIGEHRK